MTAEFSSEKRMCHIICATTWQDFHTVNEASLSIEQKELLLCWQVKDADLNLDFFENCHFVPNLVNSNYD